MPPVAGRRVSSLIGAVAAGSVVIVVIGAIVAAVLSSALRNSPLTAGASPTAAAASLEVSAVSTPSEPGGPSQSAAPTTDVIASTSNKAAGPCDRNPRVTVSVPSGNTDRAKLYFKLLSTRPGEPVCANAEVFVSWTSYHYGRDGRQYLHGGSGFDIPTRTWMPYVTVDMGCRGDLYVYARTYEYGILEPGEHHPLPMASASNGWKGEIASFISKPMVCPDGPGGPIDPEPGATTRPPADDPPPADNPPPSADPSPTPSSEPGGQAE